MHCNLPPPNNPIKLPTPIKIKPLLEFLEGYDPEDTLYLLKGFTQGFSIEFTGERSFFSCRQS